MRIPPKRHILFFVRVTDAVDARRRYQPFSPQALAERLTTMNARRFRVAYSGGGDSHVLLHALAQVRECLPPMCALHVDHGLQAGSAEWARHCAEVCESLQIPLTLLKIDARAMAGESPEAAARRARYHALAETMAGGDCLLTAHHQDDQAETLLLQLLRGAGPHGLAAMPELAPFASGRHARPLLPYPREQLRDYAQRHALHWIDDPSNADSGFDRNYLRKAVMPSLRERWPAAARVLSRAAAHQAEAAQLLDELAATDLAQCRDRDNTLNITALNILNEARQRNVLRHWLKSLGHSLPDTVRLAQLQHDLLHAAPDRAPTLAWPGVTVRRYRHRLYALPPLPGVDRTSILPWDMAAPLHLPDGTRLTAVAVRGAGVKAALCHDQPVIVRYRQGGEKCRPAPRAANRPLKHLLQEAGVPPWERERLPLIYLGGKLAVVAGYWVCAPCQAEGDEPGMQISWGR